MHAYIQIQINSSVFTNDVRGGVTEELEGREEVEETLREKLEVAMSHVVHEVNVSNVSHDGNDGEDPTQGRRYHRYGKE